MSSSLQPRAASREPEMIARRPFLPPRRRRLQLVLEADMVVCLQPVVGRSWAWMASSRSRAPDRVSRTRAVFWTPADGGPGLVRIRAGRNQPPTAILCMVLLRKPSQSFAKLRKARHSFRTTRILTHALARRPTRSFELHAGDQSRSVPRAARLWGGPEGTRAGGQVHTASSTALKV